MSASRISRVALAAAAALCLGVALAQDKPADIEALKTQARNGSTKAMRELAEIYYAGRDGVEQSTKEAIVWYTMLAKRNDTRAQTTLGTIYARGYGVEKNLAMAVYWWELAAKRQDPGAFYNLGVCYASGQGVARDDKLAADNYFEAARRGHVQAQHNLGLMYHEGKGVARDPVLAYSWLRIAALMGADESQEALKNVGKGMGPDQLRQAETRAQEWIRTYKKEVVGK